MDEVRELENLLGLFKFSSKSDELIWLPMQTSFSSKAGVEWLSNNSQIDNIHWNFIWSLKVPPKITIFLWKIQ